MMRRRYLHLSALLVLIFQTGAAQKGLTTFGLGLRPGFPSKYFRTGPVTFVDSTTTFNQVQESGLSYGGFIRHGLNNRFTLETGIVYTKRNYSFGAQDALVNEQGDFSIIGYEIPFSGLVFIQLGQQLWMNGGLGASLDIFPSDVATSGPRTLQYSARERKVNSAVSAQLGFEWRTRKSGSIYSGAYYHRGLQTFYTNVIETYPDGDFSGKYATLGRTTMQGDYFGLEFKYFFHEDPAKKKSKKQKTGGGKK